MSLVFGDIDVQFTPLWSINREKNFFVCLFVYSYL